MSSTTLYGLDSARDMLVTQGSVGGAPVSPNTGQLFSVGALGVDTGDIAGFDISVFGGAFALLTAPVASTSQLYTINLSTGAATLIGTVGVGAPLTAFAFEPVGGARAFALTGSNQLISFNVGLPGNLLSSTSITGLQSGETLLGIDFRPARGTLVGLGSSSRLYSVDPVSGAATMIGTGPFTPALSGNEFGVDFNPAVDRVRVVSDAGQNLRLHPSTGAVAGVDTNLAFAAGDPNAGVAPRVVASAYDRNFAATGQTTLFAIDSNLDVLATQGSVNGSPTSPNTGTLLTVGALGFDTSDLAGFDLSAFGGAFAALTAPGGASSQLVRINLTTGASTAIGSIAGGATVRDFAILPAGL